MPHTKGQMVTLSLRRCCCNFGQTLYVTKRNKQAANSRYPVVALQNQDGNGGRPQTAMLSWQFLEESVIAWKVAGSCHQLLAIWSFQSIAWLRVFMCITGIAPELGYTVGSLAMLCHRVHEFQLLRDFPALTSKANEPCLSGYKLQLGLTGMTRKISSCSWPMPKNSKKPSEILKRCAT